MSLVQTPMQKLSAFKLATPIFKRYGTVAVGILLAAIAFMSVSIFPFVKFIPDVLKIAIAIFGLGLLIASYRNSHVFWIFVTSIAIGASFGFTTVGILI